MSVALSGHIEHERRKGVGEGAGEGVGGGELDEWGREFEEAVARE